MIIGIGSDIININRIERVLERYGDRFIKRIFTPVEKEKSEQRISRVESYAKRFAAKEACAKALGTGFRKGIFWRDMGVVNLTSGQPTMQLTGNAEKRLIEITPDGVQSKIDISLTDEPPFAQAVVVITAVAS